MRTVAQTPGCREGVGTLLIRVVCQFHMLKFKTSYGFILKMGNLVVLSGSCHQRIPRPDNSWARQSSQGANRPCARIFPLVYLLPCNDDSSPNLGSSSLGLSVRLTP